MKKGLVLEGGAMRGIFTCGVLDVFMEQGILFDGAIGVSAGAAFGCNFKSRQIGRALRYNKIYCSDPRYCSISSLLKTGDIYNVDFCYHTLPVRLDPWDYETFCQNPMEFYCCATDCASGRPVYHLFGKGLEEDLQWIRASASIPIVSRPVELEGGKYMDGGMSDPIPLRFMEQQGYDRNVIIETQPRNYVKLPYRGVSLMALPLRNCPGVLQAIRVRHLLYNAEKAYIRSKENRGEVFVIRPEKPLGISSTEKHPWELQHVYDIGRRTAEGLLPALAKWLSAEK